MILLLDNYDSFVHNLARYLERLGQRTLVVRSDAIGPGAVRALRPAAIVVSPGPCTPNEAGCSTEVVRCLAADIPLLGVCLGHQAIAAAFGARIVRAAEPMHGRASQVLHAAAGLFAGIASPMRAARYHSLVVDPRSLPDCLDVTARTADGTIMGLAHRRYPVFGVQFHPESILTPDGFPLLANFLRLAGLDVAGLPRHADEQFVARQPPWTLPELPVTF